jgi:hypothetical protein
MFASGCEEAISMKERTNASPWTVYFKAFNLGGTG